MKVLEVIIKGYEGGTVCLDLSFVLKVVVFVSKENRIQCVAKGGGGVCWTSYTAGFLHSLCDQIENLQNYLPTPVKNLEEERVSCRQTSAAKSLSRIFSRQRNFALPSIS